MKLPKLWRREAKESPVGASYLVAGGGDWKRPANTREYIAEGYQLNVVVYRSVREIVRAVADLALEVHSGEDVVTDHSALDLLRRPNPTTGWNGFIGEAFTDYLLAGEMAMVRYPANGRPIELWRVAPLDVEVVPGPSGTPALYVHSRGGARREFAVDRLTGQSQMFFTKMYDPLNYWRGQAPLVAAGLAADTHNAGMRWNYALLKNSARPSGLIKLAGDGSGEVVVRLREWFKRAFQGERAAGEIPILTGGADWVPMDTNPRDMDFVTTQKEAAKLIASAFGVPLPLIDNDASTFNNLEQAKERFYSDTVLPMFNEFLAAFGNWLLPWYGDDLTFGVDLDKVAALEGVRTRKYDRVIKAKAAGVLTVDETRVALGYEPLGGAAALLDPLAGFDVTKAVDLAYGP